MQKKRNVLFVMDGLKIGGVESALISVLRFLDYSRYDVELLLLHRLDDLKDEVPQSVKLRYLDESPSSGRGFAFFACWLLGKLFSLLCLRKAAGHFNRKMQYAIAAGKAKALLKKEYDAVIAYKHGEAESFTAFSLKAKQKILFYHHGSILDDALHRRTFPRFRRIVAVSDGVEQMLAAAYPACREKLTVIPNYVDPVRILQRAEEGVIERPQGKLLLCTVGRMSPEKNYPLALEVACALRERGIDFLWYFIGDGEQRTAIEAQTISCGMSGSIVLTGALRNPLPYVKACDIYVQPSDVESYGLSIQEALILGKPVVSTRTIGGRLLLEGRQGTALADAQSGSIADAIVSLQGGEQTQADPGEWEEKDRKTSKLWAELLQA